MDKFFNFCNEMLCVANHRGYFVKLNPAWTNTLGWSLEELTSRPYLDFVHPDDTEATLREAKRLSTNEYETVQFQNRYRCKDGSFRWLAWQAKNLIDTGDILATARDVTQQEHQLEALRDSENRFRSLANHASIGIAQADSSGHTTYVNQRMCEILGVTPEQLLGLNWQSRFHPADRMAFLEAWRTHVAEGVDMPPYEIRMSAEGDSFRWVNCSVALVKNAAGEVESQIATVEDVHARKVYEQRLRTIFTQSPVGIALLDSHTGRFLEVNPKLAEMLGRSQEEVMATDFQSVTHPADLQQDLDNMALLRAAEIQQFRMEKRYVRPDGSLTWAHLTVVPLWHPSEKPSHHLAIADDITDRKLAEEKLQTREAQLAGLLDYSSNIVYLKDHEGRYLLGNASFYDFCGKSPSEVIGFTDDELYPPETAKIFQATDALVWRDQMAHTVEEFVPHTERPQTYRSVKFPVKDKLGNMLAIGGISTDVTDLTTAYENLANKERVLRNLIEVQEKEQQFICYEFHDGLIQYATGSLMALESLQDHDLPAKAAQVIDEVVKYLRAGIADGRRVIRGSRPTVLDDMGAQAAIEDLIDLLSAEDFTIDLQFDPEIGQLPPLLATTIYRVVQEALNNTRKHSGSPRAFVAVNKVQNQLHIQVQDYGCGFKRDPANQTGFGLVGMTERVRLLGGECLIESALGEGTTVKIRLPLEANEESAIVQ